MILKLKKQGFTLVETIIYSALLVVLGSGLVSFSFSLLAMHQKTMSAKEVMANAKMIDRVLEYYVENEALRNKYPEAGASTSLELVLKDSSEWKLYVEDNRLWQQKDKQPGVAISGSEVTINNLLINNFSGGDKPSFSIECDISFANSDNLNYNYNYKYLGTYAIKNVSD